MQLLLALRLCLTFNVSILTGGKPPVQRKHSNTINNATVCFNPHRREASGAALLVFFRV